MHHLSISSYLPCALVPPHNKIQFKRTKRRKFYHRSWSVTLSHTVNPFDHVPLLGSAHCKESLIWFEASGFCHIFDAGISLRLLGYPIVALCHGNPAGLSLQLLGGGHLSPIHTTVWQIRRGVSSAVMPRWDLGPTLPSAEAGRGQGQLLRPPPVAG